MIDYEKLDYAHQLCRKMPGYYFDAEFGRRKPWFELYDLNGEERYLVWETGDIDELIAQLEELTKTELKYAVGDIVWRKTFNNEFCECVIKEIYNHKCGEYLCKDKDDGYEDVHHEEDLYPTREALIKDQIAHWSSMLEPEDETKNFMDSYINNMFQDENASQKINEMFSTPDDTPRETEQCEHEEGYLKAGVEHSWARLDDTHKKPDECAHNPIHGWFMTGPEPGHGFIHKCKKCREFYR